MTPSLNEEASSAKQCTYYGEASLLEWAPQAETYGRTSHSWLRQPKYTLIVERMSPPLIGVVYTTKWAWNEQHRNTFAWVP